jgi:hypothetical protein
MSDDICMYELIEELKAEVKKLCKELMLVEAERDDAIRDAEVWQEKYWNTYNGGSN